VPGFFPTRVRPRTHGRRWLSLLVTSFIVFLLAPNYRNFNKRVAKSPTLFLLIPGWRAGCSAYKASTKPDPPPRGALFENLMVSECFKAYTHQRQQQSLYFWRTQTGHEIGLIVEEDNQLFTAEIKTGQTVSPDMFDTLRW
jgi:predicted AAA+ superfamily ATPase